MRLRLTVVSAVLPALVFASQVAVPARDAEACSCSYPDEHVIPAPGAVGVPLDVHVYHRAGVDAPQDQGLVLREAGSLVEVAASAVDLGWFTELTPDAPLAAETTYDLLHGGAVVASFTTGTTSVDAPPAKPILTTFKMEHAPLAGPASSCEETGFDFLAVIVEPDPAVAAYEIHFEDDSEEPASQDVFLTPEELATWDGRVRPVCGPSGPIQTPGARWCVTVVARGFDAQTSAATTQCTTVNACLPLEVNQSEHFCMTDYDDQDLGSGGGGCSAAGARGASTGGGLAATLALLALGAGRRRGRMRGCSSAAGASPRL